MKRFVVRLVREQTHRQSEVANIFAESEDQIRNEMTERGYDVKSCRETYTLV